MGQSHNVFITGGTGYMGQRLIPELLKRGHTVRALARKGSEQKLPSGCEVIVGDALNKWSFQHHIDPSDTFVQLVGVSHPSPAKAKEFRDIDLKAGTAAIEACAAVHMRHFVYLSVAHPAPAMQAYVDVRQECETLIRCTGMNASILRPWYVTGPGHRWPYALLPFYKMAELLPPTRESALRLGLVTIEDMVATLVDAVEHPARGVKIAEVPQIRLGKMTSPVLEMAAGE